MNKVITKNNKLYIIYLLREFVSVYYLLITIFFI